MLCRTTSVGDEAVLGVLAGEGGEEDPHAPATELIEVLAHGGERWDGERGLGGVVEPDHTHVVGDAAAGFVESEEHAHRHLVVGGEDRGDVGIGGEHRPAS